MSRCPTTLSGDWSEWVWPLKTQALGFLGVTVSSSVFVFPLVLWRISFSGALRCFIHALVFPAPHGCCLVVLLCVFSRLCDRLPSYLINFSCRSLTLSFLLCTSFLFHLLSSCLFFLCVFCFVVFRFPWVLYLPAAGSPLDSHVVTESINPWTFPAASLWIHLCIGPTL